MPKDDKIWSDSFNQSSLENEDWLEPSPLVFEKVKEEIYDKKRKRNFFLFLVSLFGILAVGFALTIYLSGKNDSVLLSLQDQLIEETTSLPNKLDDRNSDAEIIEDTSSHALMTSSKIDVENNGIRLKETYQIQLLFRLLM